MGSKARQAADEVNRQQAGRRNLIINGAMQVWQRGTSFTGISSGYYADRFQWTRTATMSVSRSTDVPDGFLYSCKSDVTAAGNWTLYHPLENPKRFKSGQKLTLSFYAKASTATDFRIGRVWDGSAYIAGYTVQNIGTEWKRYTQEITLSSDALTQEALWVQVVSNNASLSSGLSVYITGVQLELGSVATPFEHRSYGEELALCQRYYQQPFKYTGSSNRRMLSGGYGDGGNTAFFTINYPPMRTLPTASTTGNFQMQDGGSGFYDVTVNTLQVDSDRSLYFGLNSASVTVGNVHLAIHKGASSINLDAEL